MRGFLMNREGLTAGLLLPVSATLKATEPITLLNAPIWSVPINQREVMVTISDLLAIAGGFVGVAALVLAILKHFKPK